jgi:hypothetical protein
MEIMLAIVVVAAVIFFGALISMGNERQKRAIDNLREQVVLWAMQDLRIKRERLTRDVRVDDPLGWLNKIAARAYGCAMNLQIIEVFDNPGVIICNVEGGSGKIFFTPLSPSEIRAMKRAKNNRLSQYADRNPLLSLPRNVTAFECSVLNNGILFDLELPLAWKGLTGNHTDEMSVIWMYTALGAS